MEHEQIIPKLKVGIFYDGYYFSRTSNYYKSEHAVGNSISFKGMQDFILSKASEVTGINKEDCYVKTSQYFSGRNPANQVNPDTYQLVKEKVVDEMLRKENVIPQYLPIEDGKEKGIDVFLALSAYNAAIDDGLDLVVLITGDGDFQTLPRMLEMRGTKFMLICWDYDSSPKADGSPSQTRTSQNLLYQAHYFFEMYPIIEEGLKNKDPLVQGMFGIKPIKKRPGKHLGKIKRLDKRNGVIEMLAGGGFFRFWRDQQDLGTDFTKLMEGQQVSFKKNPQGQISDIEVIET